jgi:GNAT superfamily N-acetyltransferase
MSLSIRPAVVADIPLILSLIRKLAEYERLLPHAVATPEDLKRWLFGERPAAETVIAEWDGTPVGFALFFHNFSTFRGKPGIYLEDLFVEPEFRGKGIGQELLRHLARLATERGCARLEWSVLDWNEPAIGFYKSLGAVPLSDWTIFRVSGDALETLAKG